MVVKMVLRALQIPKQNMFVVVFEVMWRIKVALLEKSALFSLSCFSRLSPVAFLFFFFYVVALYHFVSFCLFDPLTVYNYLLLLIQ